MLLSHRIALEAPALNSIPVVPSTLLTCLDSIMSPPGQDEGPRDAVDRKVSDLEFSEAELLGEEGVWASVKTGKAVIVGPSPLIPAPITLWALSLGDTSAGCVVTESDPELEVEYRESREAELGPMGLDSASLSDADTVNPDEDSFSILGGDSPTGPESLVHDLPPLFLHLTCSVRLRGQHSSVPVCSLPTCLGELMV